MKRILASLAITVVLIFGLVSPASATSGWRYTGTSTCCRGGMDIDGPAGTTYVYDFQWSLVNYDVWGTGNNSFYVYLAGPEVIVPWSSVTLEPGQSMNRVITEYRYLTPGTYCLQVWSYTYPGGYYGRACASVR